MAPRSFHILLCSLLVAASAQAVAGRARTISRAAVFAQVSILAELGRGLFFDPALSASGRLSCASCHDPAQAYGPPDARPVVPGGKDMRQMGLRAVPSLKYLQATPQFTEHFHDSDDDGDASVDNGPTGGLTWDGRVDRGRDQARLPLLSPFEMANDGPAAVVTAVRKSAYAGMLRQAFGAAIFADTEKAFDGILQALEAYEQRYAEFYPYSSKYDAWLAGKATLTAAEARGLALFDDPAKGNCAHCHISTRGADGTPPQSTITAWPHWACRAIWRSWPMPTRRSTISACAGRCAWISGTGRNIAACSSRPACAMSRCAGRSSITAYSTR
jgi:cytochrome c peroxidase